jgi:uncharacterized protein
MGTPVVHFEIMGGKGNQLEKFYEELFGWRIDSNNPMQYGMIDTCAGEGIQGAVGPSHDGGKRVSVYLRVRRFGRNAGQGGEARRQSSPAAKPGPGRS